MKRLIKWIGLGLLLLLLGFSLQKLPGETSKPDFRAYWSASYLLAQGKNFADETLLLATEQELTGFDKDFAIKTWNPPWVLAWLLPYTWFSFDTASRLWLLTNVSFLLFAVVTSWQLIFPVNQQPQRWVWLPLLAAMLFPSTIVALMFGQVNVLLLGGVVGFLVLYGKGRDVPAGFALALTTFKPHLVYLVVPIFVFHSWKQRRWRVSAAFLSLLVFSMFVVLLLRPTFLADYVEGTVAGNLLAWEAATAVTYLSLKTGWFWIRLIAVVLLPLVCLSWFYLGEKWDLMRVAQVGILASVITMPFGWSYDFVVLLLPLTQIVAWLVTKKFLLFERFVLIIMLLVVYITYFYQRIITPSELYFFWVPLAIATMYGWAAWRGQER